MRRRGLCALVLVMASCASSKSASKDTPSGGEAATASGPATSTAQPMPTGPSGTDRQQATADLANAQARLQEAERELELARSETAAANGDVNAARAQMDRASKATDSIAQARAAEVARAAETRQQTAAAHVDYATKLVAARQADIDAAKLGAGENASAVSVSGTGSSGGAQPSASAQDAARKRASELGKVALVAQRRWEEAAQHARALPAGATSDPSMTGTGAGTAPPPPPTPPPPQSAVPVGQ
jgi:hypothetical protein